MGKLTDFMISKVRVKMFELFFSNPSQLYYVREITRLLDEEINAVRRELDRMHEAGIVKSEKRGNRLYYFLNNQYEFYPELLRLISKSHGLGKAISKKRRDIGSPKFVMFSSKFAQHKARGINEVDILLVGNLKLKELEPLIKAEETLRGHEINYTIMSSEEFDFRKARRDPFVNDILSGGRIMIIGDEDLLVEKKQEV